MKNLGIFKLVALLLFVSCTAKITDSRCENNYLCREAVSREIAGARIKKLTGSFYYPKLGFSIGFKYGSLNGIMSIITEEDTIYFCRYKNDKPQGIFINKIGFSENRQYAPLIHVQSAVQIRGSGSFDKNGKKQGKWNEFIGTCNNIGVFVDGKKTGKWFEDCFNDNGVYTSKRIVNYEKDSIINSHE